jgi:hypothetical protein
LEAAKPLSLQGQLSVRQECVRLLVHVVEDGGPRVRSVLSPSAFSDVGLECGNHHPPPYR